MNEDVQYAWKGLVRRGTSGVRRWGEILNPVLICVRIGLVIQNPVIYLPTGETLNELYPPMIHFQC